MAAKARSRKFDARHDFARIGRPLRQLQKPLRLASRVRIGNDERGSLDRFK
jgi:hypothetical protein